MRKLTETEISQHDTKAIFNIASSLRDNPSGLGRFFKSQRKDKIGAADLQKAWQENGYPDDIRDIEHLLKGFGFDKKEINKVFASAFGKSDDNDYDEPEEVNPGILKIAQYAKKAGIDKDIIEFLKKEYGFNESHKFEGKAVIEEVRKIFDEIVREERHALPEMVRSAEQQQLGRNRK